MDMERGGFGDGRGWRLGWNNLPSFFPIVAIQHTIIDTADFKQDALA